MNPSITADDLARMRHGLLFAERWAEDAGWAVAAVERRDDGATVTVLGPLPTPDPDALRAALDAEGLDDLDVRVRMVPQEEVLLRGS